MGVATSTHCGGGGPHGPEEGQEPENVLPINSAFLAFIPLAVLPTHLEGHLTPGYTVV